MSSVSARRVDGVWRVRAGRATGGEPFLPAAAGIPPVEAFLREYGRSVPDRLWFLELSKVQLQSDAALLDDARRFVGRCLAGPGPDAGLCWRTPDAARAARAVRVMLRARGEAVDGAWWDAVRPALALVAAWVVAAAVWVWSLAAHHPVRTRRPAHADTIHAIHGERSNRARALLPPAVPLDPAVPYLILGRPRRSLRRLAAKLGLAGDPRPVLFRAGSWSAGVASLRALPPLLRAGLESLRETPAVPAWRELVGISYRMQMGACHAAWWEAAGLRPRLVLYGHTGVADTTALELAQQAAGARTVHLAHGISAGWNFTGCSSLGVFQCGFDADWHARLPAYGATTFPATEMPAARSGGSGWVICSNLLHPMNPVLAREGAGPELRLLDLIAAAARLCADPPARIVWKPHPTFRTLAPAIREAALARVAELGFARWDEAQGLGALAEYRTVLTTPSTVAIDAMRLGKLPIVVAADPYATETVVGAFPFGGPDAESLARKIELIETPAVHAGEFQRVWRRVGPGAAVTVEYLRQLEAAGESRPVTEAPEMPHSEEVRRRA